MHRVLGPSGTEAGPAIKVPLKLVTWERWQRDGGDTRLGGDTCLGAHVGWSWEMSSCKPGPHEASQLRALAGAGAAGGC